MKDLGPRGRRLLILFVAALSLLALVASAIAWAFSSLELDRFRGSIEQQLSTLLGREVKVGSIEKDAGLLEPRLKILEIDVYRDAVSRSPLAHVDEITVGLELRALLRRTVRIARIDASGLGVTLGSDAAGKPLWPVNLTRRAPDEGSGVHIELDELGLDDASLVFHDGQRGELWRSFVDELEIVIHRDGSIELELVGEVEKQPVALSGRIGPRPGDEAPQAITLDGRVADVTLEASGSASNLLELTGLDVEIEARAPRLPVFDDWGRRLKLAPLQLTARVRELDGALAADDLVFELGSGAQRLRLAGRIDDLAGERRGALDGTLELEDLRGLPHLFDFDLPKAGPVRASMQIMTAGDRVHLENIDLTAGAEGAGADGPLRARVTGRLSDLTGMVAPDLQARLEANRLGDLLTLEDQRLEELGPFSFQAHAVGAGRAVHLREIVAQIGSEEDAWAKARGEVELIGFAHDLALDVQLGVPTSRWLEPWVGRELPELGPLRGNARLRGTVERVVIEKAELRLGKDGATRIAVDGRNLHLPPGETVELDAKLEAPSLRVFEPFLEGTPLPDEPVEASASLRATSQQISLHELAATLGRSQLTGAVSVSERPKGRRHVMVSLSSPEIHLGDFISEQASPDGEADLPFRERKFPIEFLRNLDAELVLRVDRLLGKAGFDASDLELRLVAQNGRLNLDPVSFHWDGGQLQARGLVNTRNGGEAKWRLHMQARGVSLEPLTAQFMDRDRPSGEAIVLASLESRGDTGQELMESLEGGFSLALRNGQLRGGPVLLLRRDLLSGLALKPLRQDVATTPCVVGRFLVEEGVATTETFLIEGEQVLVHGRGSIDLGRERVDMTLTPKAKRVGIGLLYPVAITGPLGKPIVRPVKKGVGVLAAKALLGTLILPGIGTVAPFVQMGNLGRDPCGKAISTYLEPE